MSVVVNVTVAVPVVVTVPFGVQVCAPAVPWFQTIDLAGRVDIALGPGRERVPGVVRV